MDHYLPSDPSSGLIGLLPSDSPSPSPTPGFPPAAWLIHGDIQPHNIYIKTIECGRTIVPCLLDFADAGHGDPLYDLVVMIGSCFPGNQMLSKVCWDSYRASVDVSNHWPKQYLSTGGIVSRKLPHVAMCYSLLLEDDSLLSRVFHKSHSDGATMTCCLHHLENSLWGFLHDAEQ